MSRTTRLAAGLLLVAGCGRSSEPAPLDTGARDAVRGFYDSLIQKDWPGAYARLHPDSTKALAATEFHRRAEAYRAKLGFEPARVAVRTCEEHGDEATARVDLSGPGGGSRHHYEDNLFLRRHDGQWRVLLPARFGQK